MQTTNERRTAHDAWLEYANATYETGRTPISFPDWLQARDDYRETRDAAMMAGAIPPSFPNWLARHETMLEPVCVN